MGPFPERQLHRIPLIQIDTSDDEGSDQGLIGKMIKQNESDKKPSEEVSHTTFLAAAKMFGDQTDDEEKFDEEGNWKQVKLEVVSESETEEETLVEENIDQNRDSPD